MIRVNNVVLMLCFALAMGCGESSSGQSGQQTDVSSKADFSTETVADTSAAQSGQQSAQQEPEPEQIAALDKAESGSAAGSLADASAVTYVEGTHYEKLPRPVPTTDANKIEVAEVFWYGCGHCYHFEPLLSKWQEGVADDVVVVKSPAMWDKDGVMAKHARIYYAAKALGVLDVVSDAAFRALNVDHNPLRTDDSIAKLFTDNGVSQEDFDKTFTSFGVTSSVRQAEARQRSYRVQGTPEVVVNGTYRVSTRMAGGQETVLKVTDYLIEKVRMDKSGS